MTRKLRRRPNDSRPHPGQTEETRACSVKLFANRRTDNLEDLRTLNKVGVFSFIQLQKALIPVTA
uniref:Uncharacterized protein n=1 Tax=Anguilla anguilla TaxID=7936 RepID=A0A0E9V9U0_ANGAN